MGNISSSPDDGAGVYMRDQQRFSFSSVAISSARHRSLLRVVPNSFPASRAIAKRSPSDDRPIEYIQDPESSPENLGFLLRLQNEDELTLVFSILVRQTPPTSSETSSVGADTTINGLTLIFAPSPKDVDFLVTREFHADPNFHKNPNVELVQSEVTTGGSSSVQLDYSWKWRPPKASDDKGGGWRTVCSFVEYDQRAHKLNTLASFSFWVQNSRTSPSTQLLSPQRHMLGAPRVRVASSQSTHSMLSDSEGGNDRDVPSPIAETDAGVPLTQSSTNTIVDVACQRPGEDLSAVEDGPLFRATMKALEQKTGSMKGRMKKLLKKAGAAQAAQVQCNEAVSQFMDALREAALSNANAIQPALEHYFEKIAREILTYENENSTNLQKLIIDPLSKLYNIDIKQAEFKKRDFEDESKDFYAYVGRYLGQRQDSLKEKKRIESDSKYQNKRRMFELKRFDYSSFMQDLHGGRKEQEVLSHLTRYANTQTKSYLTTGKKIEEMVPQLDALIREVTEADKEFSIQRTEREEKRRLIEKSSKPPIDADNAQITGAVSGPLSTVDTEAARAEASSRTPLHHSNSTTSQTGSVAGGSTGLAPSNSVKPIASPGTSPSSDPYKMPREGEEKENGMPAIAEHAVALQRKEGLLWALSRPGSHVDPRGLNKQAWHKYWIVLDQGRLSEYSNWKERLDLHMDPIDIRLASVREARSSERRFCFEIITPSFKRVYQATSEDDMNNWIGAINNALQGAFEARSQPQSFDPSSTESTLKRDIGSVLMGKSPISGSKEGGSSYNVNQNLSNNNAMYRRITVGARPSYIRSNSSSYEENPKKLLQEVRDRDEGNLSCADCTSRVNTDWVSINLGVVLCIECSGVHRSLGTHVSKIRSLTLDTVSFTVDIVEAIMEIGNRNSNRIWEARLDPANKAKASSLWEERRRFITDKYVQRAFVSPISASNSAFGTADETLLASIKRNDIQQVLYALAVGASPNAADKSRNTHAVFLALAAADPASPHAQPVPGVNGPGMRPRAFPVAELLVQNGSTIPSAMPAFPLSSAAQQYIEQKRSKETLVVMPPVKSSGHAPERERERLQKRISAGARFNGRSTGH